ncbi:hypothetical protein OA005_02565 [Paracoccaceae bacterium]|nr:hypothetical protein [Paracoccaceae bacterium]
MKNQRTDFKVDLNMQGLKRRVILEAVATAMLANLKLRKQKS